MEKAREGESEGKGDQMLGKRDADKNEYIERERKRKKKTRK